MKSKNGDWEVRWRYRRLPPSDWKPRKRAVQCGEVIDVVSDPRALGNQFQFDYCENETKTVAIRNRLCLS